MLTPDRRAFLRTVALAVAGGALLDVDRLLWTPGARTIFLPPVVPSGLERFVVGNIVQVDGELLQITRIDGAGPWRWLTVQSTAWSGDGTVPVAPPIRRVLAEESIPRLWLTPTGFTLRTAQDEAACPEARGRAVPPHWPPHSSGRLTLSHAEQVSGVLVPSRRRA